MRTQVEESRQTKAEIYNKACQLSLEVCWVNLTSSFDLKKGKDIYIRHVIPYYVWKRVRRLNLIDRLVVETVQRQATLFGCRC